MSNLAADKVLRVNCPGWGVSSTLPLGEAKPLAMYDVIVVNPSSIVHLFEPKSDTAKQIEKLLADGSSTLKLDSDSQLESISAELELREHELRQFLSKGGLLIYFLAPPFTVAGPSQSMDNFIWLYECIPDKADGNGRAMSANGRGKDLDMGVRAKQHPFSAYLQQSGLEWSTLIKKENLAEGYKVLANAGRGKAIAGYKSTGPKKGQVIFLPAPYETKYDDVLKECILKWHDLHLSPDADSPEEDVIEDEPAAVDTEPEIEGRALLDDLFSDDSDKKGGSFATASSSSNALNSPFGGDDEGDGFDSLDSLFSSGGKTEAKEEAPPEEQHSEEARKFLAEMRDTPLTEINKAVAEMDSESEPEPEPVAPPEKSSSLDWPELDNDIPPFAKEREAEREKEKARQEERDRAQKEKAREEEEEREKERSRDQEKDKEREREREREREKEREREQERDREREREREKEREQERAKQEEREKEERAREKEREKAEREERERAEEQRARDEEREKSARERERARGEDRDRVSSNGSDRESSSSMSFPEAKDLMSRMEHEISNHDVPEWCQKVSFTELKQLNIELTDLNDQVRRARQKINDIEDRIRNLGELKDALLSVSGTRLTQACCKVFEALGWTAKISETSSGEVWLNDGDKTQAIVRVVFSLAQPNRSELAELAESVITYWGKYDVEPKGILVASTFAEKAPKDRVDEDFPGSMGDFAKRKNLCLSTTMQLLTMYRDITIKNADTRKMRENILTTSGIMSGFRLELTDVAAEAAAK